MQPRVFFVEAGFQSRLHHRRVRKRKWTGGLLFFGFQYEGDPKFANHYFFLIVQRGLLRIVTGVVNNYTNCGYKIQRIALYSNLTP